MERLWTPWRLPYVTEASGSVSGCIFCDAQARIEEIPQPVTEDIHREYGQHDRQSRKDRQPPTTA